MPADEPSARMSVGYRRYAMTLLLVISMANYLDRQIVNILAEPIKNDLGLKDWELGLLTGLAFGVLYTFLGLPIARLAERGHRPYIIATATAVWSVFTMMCGIVASFWQLALARVGVGVGEAGCTPPAHSLIMDYAPPEKRGSALAFYGLGPPLGGLLGMAFGGLVADAYGWRTAFLLAGAPGVVLALLAATSMKEPRRHVAAPRRAPTPGGRAMFRLVAGKRAYWLLLAAITVVVFTMSGYGPFLGSFYLRNHGAEIAAAAGAIGGRLGFELGPVGFLGIALGLLGGASGALGVFSGGRLADRLGVRDARFHLLLPAVSVILWVPLFMLAMVVPSLFLSLALYGLSHFVGFLWYGPAYTAWFSLVPANMRATNSALSLFTSNLIGLGLAPLGVGLLSDIYARSLGSGGGIRWALFSFAVVGIANGLLFLAASRTYRADVEA